MMLEVRVLGPLAAQAGGVSLPLGTPKQQAVLAMLAVRPGRLVGLTELVDELWPERPPASAVANARSYAANLRRLFDATESTRNLIIRQGPGYQLRVRPEQVDLTGFMTECRQAAEALARHDIATAAKLLDDAESRWRGPMLAGVPRGSVLTARCDAIEEERVKLVEQRAELHLMSGQPRLAITLLHDHLGRCRAPVCRVVSERRSGRLPLGTGWRDLRLSCRRRSDRGAVWSRSRAADLGADAQENGEAVPSDEYASLIIDSMETGVPRVFNGNVMNNGLIDNLPQGCCVEVPCLVDGNGIQPTVIGSLPPQLAALIQTNVSMQGMTVEAALTRKREHIYHAAMLDPRTAAELNLDSE